MNASTLGKTTGDGLFARSHIPAMTTVVVYAGNVYNYEEAEDRIAKANLTLEEEFRVRANWMAHK